eukprot:TRINITY_DN4557_c0_g1_i1.p1 TRINITY_DN4557_c0_g1~~TRINITY_DN4557_c0_g1_i1.p1  ORF type:complete len:923 (+),score=331.36 TRINITY_DN4557_c0_g1_i1:136-2904(+)
MGRTIWGEDEQSSTLMAALVGDVVHLESIAQLPDDVNQTDEHMSTPLHQAAYGGHLHCLVFLTEMGANLDARDANGFTPLQVAAFRGHHACVKYLVEQHADVNMKDINGSTAVHKAALYNHPECLSTLIDFGGDVFATTSYRKTPLHLACEDGHLKCVETLIERGAPLDATDKDGNTPLHQAAIQQHVQCVSKLVSSGADRVIKNRDGATPLHQATDVGDMECTLLLIADGKDRGLDTGDNNGVTPLHQTCYYAYSDIAAKLLEAGAKPAVSDVNGTTPVHVAAHMGNTECLEAVLAAARKNDGDKGLKQVLAAQDNAGATALHKAAFKGNNECAKVLLERGADVDGVDNEGASPLHKAAFGGHEQCVRLLTEHKANCNLADKTGETPLHKAAFNNNDECLSVMIEGGGNCSTQDENGFSPIHLAAFVGSVSCLLKMLDSKPDVNCRDALGYTPLHLAVLRGIRNVVEYLLSSMADTGLRIDEKDAKGRTPLWHAVHENDEPIARALIYEEADETIADENGESPITLGKEKKNRISPDRIKKMKADGENYRRRRHLQDPVTKAKITKAVALFNNKPAKGLRMLVDEQVLADTPQDLAEFLMREEKLEKVAIGEILSEQNQSDLLNAFVDLMDFGGMEFDEALRKFLGYFRLPGEAQKIDRLMEAFAGRYYVHNKDSTPFVDADAAYVLAFSTIMLNTDAHNPAIKKANKMTKRQFVGNNRGINGGANLPQEFLEDLYDRINEDEIKMDDDGSTYANAEKKGYLTKQGGRIKTWKKRWFVLTNNCLYYFREKADKDPCGIIPLESLEIISVPFGKKGFRKYAFIIQPQGGEGNIKACKLVDGNVVTGNHSRYIVSCETEREREGWITSINASMKMIPFQHLLDQKNDRAKASRLISGEHYELEDGSPSAYPPPELMPEPESNE